MAGLWQYVWSGAWRGDGAAPDAAAEAAAAVPAAPEATVAEDAVVVRAHRPARRRQHRAAVAAVDEPPVAPPAAPPVAPPVDADTIPVVTLHASDLGLEEPQEREEEGQEQEGQEEQEHEERKASATQGLRFPVPPDEGSSSEARYAYLVHAAQASLWHAGTRVSALTAEPVSHAPPAAPCAAAVPPPVQPCRRLEVVSSLASHTPSPAPPLPEQEKQEQKEEEEQEPAVCGGGLGGTLPVAVVVRRTDAEQEQEQQEQREAQEEGQGAFTLRFASRRVETAANTHCPQCRALLVPGDAARCEYTGLRYCSACMGAGRCCIPGYVVFFWDTQEYPVCRSVAASLGAIAHEPLVALGELNPMLARMVPAVADAQLLRRRLFHLRHFVSACTRVAPGSPADTALRSLPAYLTDQFDLFALADLVRLPELIARLLTVLRAWLAHVAMCPLCRARGSFCEICRRPGTIFPFQIVDVVQCAKCHGVYHRACYAASLCPKCARLQARKVLAPP